ncbi:phytanoyl-CoA dioxygenase family protein [Tychonema sp. LEGE 07199]|uniref:phytanoyl-CoA dioxygenase family protein n=1 Tax=unclassified Tychonema TaxID=2642144 RepID=UPI00187F0FD5|nr:MULTISPECIES: phytanoyl-CoA dioxygenase family protein [unclassified Tychonema]MBE9122951.1 phytanoyl-CoA dioxygenase family protein [Tychonema sp. LEGE 07199]MBE9131423.1 phytanoyl-CoA dioxygenase family protein [Tychonema sp. LEGE 07196]
MNEYIEQITSSGFALASNIIDTDTIDRVSQELEAVNAAEPKIKHGPSAGGIRNILDLLPNIRGLANDDRLRKLVEPILGKQAVIIRGILFDKTSAANWKVAWHQDLTIAVRAQINVPGFNTWSIKAGIVCVQPPIFVRENILTLRLHLDDANETNGTLKVLPSSHLYGQMSAEAIQIWKQNRLAITCNVSKGGVLVMRPLLLHSSSAAIAPSRRRVIHLEYSSLDLPEGLEW